MDFEDFLRKYRKAIYSQRDEIVKQKQKFAWAGYETKLTLTGGLCFGVALQWARLFVNNKLFLPSPLVRINYLEKSPELAVYTQFISTYVFSNGKNWKHGLWANGLDTSFKEKECEIPFSAGEVAKSQIGRRTIELLNDKITDTNTALIFLESPTARHCFAVHLTQNEREPIYLLFDSSLGEYHFHAEALALWLESYMICVREFITNNIAIVPLVSKGEFNLF